LTTVSYTRDLTYPSPNPPPVGGFYWTGIVYQRDTAGANRSAAEKAAGVYLDHAYNGTRRHDVFGYYNSNQYSGGVFTHRWNTAWSGDIYLNTVPGAWDSNDEIKLLGRLADKIRGHNWHVGIFVGELGKTADTVADRTKQVARAILATKRGRFAEAITILRAKPRGREIDRALYWRRKPVIALDRYGLANWYGSWLELRYAWRPLLNDIYELSEAIRTWDVPRKAILRVSYNKKQPMQWTTVPALWTHVKTGEAKSLVALKATIVEPPLTLASHLGLNNPESLVWELVPYSFVADWFIPIGAYLETRNTLSKVSGTYVRTSYGWVKASLDSVFYDSGPSAGIRIIRSGTNVFRRWQMSITRTVNTSLTVPLPTFRNPIGSNPGTRLLDAVALITAAVKR
jgi:hypothetical protein